MKKIFSFKKKNIILLAVAALFLCGSVIGSTRAALTYYSENYMAGINTSKIDVSLMENEVETNVLLENMLPEGEELVLGKSYQEELCVVNTGDIDSYVRVILTKSWQDAEGEKDQTLSPELIDLNLLLENGWMIDESATTKERTVLYYNEVLPAGAVSKDFSDTLRIDPSIGTKVIETVEETAEGKVITFLYEYDGYTAHVDAEVDAVQTHNAQEAIKSAWGVDVTVAADGSLSLR